MRKKQADEQDTILDPDYWHILPEERRKVLQTELEDTLEAALDEGGSTVADEQFWNGMWTRFLKKVEELEADKKKDVRD